MALVLSLKSGDDFYIGNQRVAVMEVTSPNVVRLKPEHSSPKTASKGGWTDLMSNVKVRLGLTRNPESKIIRLMIDAPGRKIMRGTIYRDESKTCPTCNGKKVLFDRVPCTSKHCGVGCACKGTGFIKQEFKCPDCQ